MTESFRNLELKMERASLRTLGLSGTPRHMLASSNRHWRMQVSLRPRILPASGLSNCKANALSSASESPNAAILTRAMSITARSRSTPIEAEYLAAHARKGMRCSVNCSSRCFRSARTLAWIGERSPGHDGVGRKARRGGMATTTTEQRRGWRRPQEASFGKKRRQTASKPRLGKKGVKQQV
jgi:hypothetical protein